MSTSHQTRSTSYVPMTDVNLAGWVVPPTNTATVLGVTNLLIAIEHYNSMNAQHVSISSGIHLLHPDNSYGVNGCIRVDGKVLTRFRQPRTVSYKLEDSVETKTSSKLYRSRRYKYKMSVGNSHRTPPIIPASDTVSTTRWRHWRAKHRRWADQQPISIWTEQWKWQFIRQPNNRWSDNRNLIKRKSTCNFMWPIVGLNQKNSVSVLTISLITLERVNTCCF